mmetsp:Transcript_550/g.1686  ORF Transcript_550/g.1686 Transcript_550/m.1686 type:complete len:175 (-) Transcript_550:46-570(-)
MFILLHNFDFSVGMKNDVKRRREGVEALQSTKKQRMQLLLTQHREEMMQEKRAFFNEMGHLYNELEEKRQSEQDQGEEGGFSSSSNSSEDDPACQLMANLRGDIAYLEETVDHLLKRQSHPRHVTHFKLSADVDELDGDEDEDINVVDSDDESSQPPPAAEDDLEDEFGIYERE